MNYIIKIVQIIQNDFYCEFLNYKNSRVKLYT